VGQEQRAPEGVGAVAASAPLPLDRAPLEYRLGEGAAIRRARAAVVIGAATSIAPVAFAVMLVRRLGWGPNVAFWAVAGALTALVGVRAVVSYAAIRRRLCALVVAVSESDIRVATQRVTSIIPRLAVARIVEIEGSLGGIRVESHADPATGVISVAEIPRGGPNFAEVRARLEPWRPFERRGRRGPAARLVIGTAIVAAIFFAPFLLEDFVARSRLLAAGLVAAVWAVMRGAIRPR
jgi:hypothetical protein